MCFFCIKRFHNYVFGRHFDLVTDHKPLLGLPREDRATPPNTSSRIKRWLMFLSNYEHSLRFRNTTSHANADAKLVTPSRGACVSCQGTRTCTLG